MKVKKIVYGNTIDKYRDGESEACLLYQVGVFGVTEIIENEPRNGMGKWSYLIITENGTLYRVFNPDWVEYYKN